VIPVLRTGLVLLACAAASADAVPPVTVQPQDTGVALANPGMGFVFPFYDGSLEAWGGKLPASDTIDDFPGLSTVSFRLPWALVEPEEGRFVWSILDAPVQRFLARGREVAFRFTTSEPTLPYATPRWVEQAGAKGHRYDAGKGESSSGKLWEPDFDDPVFLAKLDRFLAAAAARYDGAPGVAFVDVGTFGARGSGRTAATTRRAYPATTAARHVDLHRQHFKKTLLVAPVGLGDEGRGEDALRYVREQGLALREDFAFGAAPDAARAAGRTPAPASARPLILETEPYGPLKERGAWADGNGVLQAIDGAHASYLSVPWWPRELMEDAETFLRKANLRLGYRLQLALASWPAEVPAGSAFTVTARWRNAGAASCLPGGHPAITLKDAQGGIVSVAVDGGLDVARLPVGAAGKADAVASSITVPVAVGTEPGVYDLYVSVGSAIGTPRLLLPLEAGDGQRRCRIGRVTVNAAPAAPAPTPRPATPPRRRGRT
jgi:hypothetical protein